jgi:general secretion pathway protein D
VSVVALRFASAEDLAKVLQPFVAPGGKIQADTGRNALVVSGDPGTRETLVSLIASFDIDVLAGQSYALFPVASGDAKDFASALQEGLSGKGGPGSAVRVVPLQRMNAVLVVAAQPRVIQDVRRVYALVDRARRQTVRVWHVFYLQNSRSNDIANVLQQAFTPHSVTAQPTPAAGSRNSGGQRGTGASGTTSGSSSVGGGLTGGRTASLAQTGSGASQADPTSTSTGGAAASGQSNPLLGGLDPSGDTAGDVDTMRIIPNPQNNAIMVYGTAQEQDTVEATLRKLDILPLQVRIDATIAEVTLNDTLKYGTQFFFRGGGLAGALGATTTGTAAGAISSAASGFLFGSADGTSAISALQAVTTVKVLSSPQLLVLDNETARLQVGDVVPFLTQSSQSTLTANAPVINSVDYRDTGVIMQVTPRVNSGGLVTLDISQEVSGINTAVTPTTGIASPTFSERAVRSRVVVQDGQTVGLAGLISDNDSRGNSGIPWLKDVPILGLLAGQQNNTRTRTELLVLITPRVVHDQRDARNLTEDMSLTLTNAATVADQLQVQRPSGSSDPSRRLRQQLNLQR